MWVDWIQFKEKESNHSDGEQPLACTLLSKWIRELGIRRRRFDAESKHALQTDYTDWIPPGHWTRCVKTLLVFVSFKADCVFLRLEKGQHVFTARSLEGPCCSEMLLWIGVGFTSCKFKWLLPRYRSTLSTEIDEFNWVIYNFTKSSMHSLPSAKLALQTMTL